VRLTKQITFEAAHQLRGEEWQDSKCSILHGHSWLVQATVSGKVNPANNAVVDFSLLSAALRKAVFQKYDHTCINDVLNVEAPTSELLAEVIFVDLEAELELMHLPCVLEVIRVRETESCWVELSR
jgi:6-pyruvoyltetrahydropterin/6-carboxytetrahydropterin synthase